MLSRSCVHACTQVVETALGIGYRMLDNAAEYGNEDEVGKALHKVL